MAKKIRSWNPGDAANSFVRVMLSDAGELLGGLSDDEWTQTIAFFDGRCAYTGAEFGADIERDHAIPMNRAHCGLHLYGNVVPATKAANREKGGKHWREFVKDQKRIDRIGAFIVESGYQKKVERFVDLQGYCEATYRMIDGMCRISKQVLQDRLPGEPLAPGGNGMDVATVSPASGLSGGLPLTFVPNPAETTFKEALLRQREAWFIITYRDGRQECKRWPARGMSANSSVVNNVRSRFRNWRGLGIKSVEVSIDRPEA